MRKDQIFKVSVGFLLILAAAIGTITVIYWNDDELVYFVEVVRHGARAPENGGDFPDGFTVQRGMLTPTGMRQRYLLGKFNYQTYGSAMNLDNIIKNTQTRDFDLTSTNYYRTL